MRTYRLIFLGAVLLLWGIWELTVGKGWFGTRDGSVEFSLQDDGWVFLVIAWGKIVVGVVLMAMALSRS